MRDTSSTLAQEMTLAKAYLDIIKIRLPKLLAFDIEMQPNIGDARLPPMMILPLMYAVGVPLERRGVAWRPLARLGRSSLFVYWIHVELVYGYASWLWRGALPLWGSLAGCVAFTVLMYGAVVGRDRIVESWRARRAAAPSLTA